MREADLPAVNRIAEAVHPGYPEDPAVFAERLALFPEGCRILAGRGGAVLGYAISHPWRAARPPALNTLLGAIPADAGTYYIHDVALLPEARGTGAAGRLMRDLRAVARRWPGGALGLSLVAVNGSEGFWRRQGLVAFEDPALAEKLRSYDAEARFMTEPG